MKKFLHAAWMVAAFVLLSSCGGGGGTPAVSAPPAPPPAVAVVLDVQPVADAVTVGTSYTFSVHATGSQPLSYQWFRAGIAIAGATASTFKLDAVAFSDDGVGYTVEVGNVVGTVQSKAASLVVKPATAPAVITACGEITTGGSYVLGNDIVGDPQTAGTSCLRIHDTRSVQLDCAQHLVAYSVAGNLQVVEVTNVQDFSIKNCRIDSFATAVTGSAYGSFTGNTLAYSGNNFTATLSVWDTHHLVVDHNTMTGVYNQGYGDSNTISNNRFTGDGSQLSGVIADINGLHTRILNNVLDGGWSGSVATGLLGTRAGADEGIVTTDETDLRIENNVIQNVWDCGIETNGSLTASVFRNNHILRAGYCGIGGWYWSSLMGNTISGNTVEKSANLFQYQRAYGLRAVGSDFEKKMAADTAVYFKDNVFDGNTLLDPISRVGIMDSAAQIPVYDSLSYAGGVSGLPGELALNASDFVLSNNVFKNNQFSTQAYAPWFGDKPVVPGVIVDGGGNKCQQPFAIYKDYPLVCN